MVRPKKRDNLVARHYKYLNYGLLGLAAKLKESGYYPSVTHGGFTDPESTARQLIASNALSNSLPILLSIPSVFAIEWAKRFCAEVKALHPTYLIVAGGRWVVGDDPQWLSSKIPELDLVVQGTAEDRVVDLLYPDRWTSIPGTNLHTSLCAGKDEQLAELDYSLLSDYQQYQPSIEVSRGCGMGCSFCAEALVALTNMKPPERILDEVVHSSQVYANSALRYYFEASVFHPTSNWIEELLIRRERASSSFVWRCETRVDSLSSSIVRRLAQAGLRVIDLGLESASPQQLLAMKKTKNPSAYLQRASEVLQACADNGVWAKVNILLYAGETLETINQTVEWLDRHRPFIKGVSVSPIIVYRSEARYSQLVASFSELGAYLVEPGRLDGDGYGMLHLSREIDAAHADDLCHEIAQRFMTAQAFYELKSFSYFSPGFSYGDFLSAAVNSDPQALSFRIDGEKQGRYS
jgi:hypothetical protein